MGAVGKAWDEVLESFDRFCLAAGVDALGAMRETDAEEACGARHVRNEGRRGHRWGPRQDWLSRRQPSSRSLASRTGMCGMIFFSLTSQPRNLPVP